MCRNIQNKMQEISKYSCNKKNLFIYYKKKIIFELNILIFQMDKLHVAFINDAIAISQLDLLFIIQIK